VKRTPRSNSLMLVVMLALELILAPPALAGSQSHWGADSWRLSTDDTQVVLSLREGWPALEALTSSQKRRNWVSSPIRESLMKSIAVDGVSKNLA